MECVDDCRQKGGSSICTLDSVCELHNYALKKIKELKLHKKPEDMSVQSVFNTMIEYELQHPALTKYKYINNLS